MQALEFEKKNDPGTAETADLMAHSEKIAAIHYYVRKKKQLSAAAESTALRKAFEKIESIASSLNQLEKPGLMQKLKY